MADTNKDTIYVDVDDEITALIDKVRASNGKVVALVLPKRATVLQSIVNMKLLKRAAENEKKHLVLITTEAGLMPLAGAVGLHVAKALTAKPEIPPGPDMVGAGFTDAIEEDLNMPLDDEEVPDLTAKAGKKATVGALADAATKTNDKQGDLETLNLDDEEDDDKTKVTEMSIPAAAAAASKVKPDKKLKVPNFDRFRLLLILGVLVLIGIIVLGVFALSVWPHAVIDIKTNASNVNTNLPLTLDPQGQTADYATGDIPAKTVSEQKTFTQTVNTTGQKNEGTDATGSVTMTATDCGPNYQYFTNYGQQFTIPAGTGLSYNNLTYITQNDTTMTLNYKKSFSGNTPSCALYDSSGPTNISAQNPGSTYNAQINNATVSGYPNVQASGSATGGTDNIVQVVSQADVNTAASKVSANDSGTVKQDLMNQLRGEGLYPIGVTFASEQPQITPNPSVGTVSNTVTITETITYTMFGTKQSYLDAALDANIHSQTSKNQNIINNGLNQNSFKQNGVSGSADQVTLATVATVGPNISVSEIKTEVAGKSPKEAIAVIKNNPDVTTVSIRLSPFWVSSIPSNQSKISVKVAKPTKSV